jgi:hypothetical protein
MKLLGITLRKPAFKEFTAATVMGGGLWVAVVGLAHLAHVPLDVASAGALLVIMVWACVSTRLGIRVDQGARHLVANLMVSGLLLGVYHVALAAAS